MRQTHAWSRPRMKCSSKSTILEDEGPEARRLDDGQKEFAFTKAGDRALLKRIAFCAECPPGFRACYSRRSVASGHRGTPAARSTSGAIVADRGNRSARRRSRRCKPEVASLDGLLGFGSRTRAISVGMSRAWTM